MTSRGLRELRRHVLIYAALIPFIVIALFPIYWMAITAFKEDADLTRRDAIPFWFQSPPTLKHFAILFHQTYFGVQLYNTLMVAVLVVTITILTAVPAAYALARLRLPGAGNIGAALFLTYLVPQTLLFLPLARVVGTLGIYDSWWSLVVLYPTFTIPYCTWILMGFFKTLPREIEEAAWVDGCSVLQGIVHVIAPLSKPGLVIAGIYAFTLSMHEVLYAVVYVGPREEKTVTLGLVTMLIRGDIFYWGSLMGAGLLVGLPIAIIYNIFLDHFVRGLTSGAGQ